VDIDGGDCTEPDQCRGGSTEASIDASSTLAVPLIGESRYGLESFRDGQLPGGLNLSALPDGPFRVCLDVLEDTVLYGSSRSGEFFSIDPQTGASSLIGTLPYWSYGASEIEVDLRSGRAFFHGASTPVLQEFDLATAHGIGPWLLTNRITYGLEFLGSELYGAPIYSYSTGESALMTISTEDGSQALIGLTGRNLLTGLAYDRDEEVLYGVEISDTSSDLVKIDLITGGASLVGSTGHSLDSLEFGPDGNLYAGSSYVDSGNLYRLDKSTGQATLVGPTGFPTVSGLALAGREREDCIELTKQGEQMLLLNRSCGQLPTARAGNDQSLQCTSFSGAGVTLDGSASSNAGAPAGTNDQLIDYEWIEDAGLPSESLIGNGKVISLDRPLGRHRITLRVRDNLGFEGIDEVLVDVVDTRRPRITAGIAPLVLWPPNHRMVPVALSASAQDECDPAPQVMWSGVASSEPDDSPGNGDGHTQDDIEAALPAPPTAQIALRAERGGAGTGRVYTVVATAQDASGNTEESSLSVFVPHDQQGTTEPVQLDVTTQQATQGGQVSLKWDDVPGAESYNVIRGEVSALSRQDSYTLVPDVGCVARGIVATEVSDPMVQDQPDPGEAYFYLVEYFDGAFSGYGTQTGGGELIITSGDSCH